MKKCKTGIRLKGLCKSMIALSAFSPAPLAAGLGTSAYLDANNELIEIENEFNESEAGKIALNEMANDIAYMEYLKANKLISDEEFDKSMEYISSNEYYIQKILQSEFGKRYSDTQKRIKISFLGAVEGSCVGAIATTGALFLGSNDIKEYEYDRPGHSEKGSLFTFSILDNKITQLLTSGAKEFVTGKEKEPEPKPERQKII